MAAVWAIDEEAILKKADYDRMPFCSSILMMRVSGEWQKANECSVYYADVVCRLTKNYSGPTFSRVDGAGAYRELTDPTKEMDQRDREFLSATTTIEHSKTHVSAGAKATLVGGRTGVVDYHVGLGCTTGAGIKDDSLHARVGGCGVTVGRKIGVSVLDNELAVDTKNCSVM